MSERSVIRAAQKGSADAVEQLIRTYWPEAYRVALGVVADAGAAEDVAQESLLSAIRSIDGFDRRRPFRPWLHRIVVNRSLDWIRARQRRAEVELMPEHLDPAASNHGSDLGGNETLAVLRALEPRERAVVVLRHLIGLNSDEIGEILGVAPGTIRSTLSRSIARLRTELEQEASDLA